MHDDVLAWVNAERLARGLGGALSELPQGQCHNADRCPIAEALGATTDGVVVFYDHAEVALPWYCAMFARRFDRGDFPELIA